MGATPPLSISTLARDQFPGSPLEVRLDGGLVWARPLALEALRSSITVHDSATAARTAKRQRAEAIDGTSLGALPSLRSFTVAVI